MRIVTGDECGLLKETIPELCRRKTKDEDAPSSSLTWTCTHSQHDGVRRVDPTENQSRSRGVVDMTFTSPSSFAALRVNGSVELWQEAHASKQTFGTFTPSGVAHNVLSASKKDDESERVQPPEPRPIALNSFMDKNRLCVADSLGRIAVLKADSLSVEATFSPFLKQTPNISYTKGQYVNMDVCSAMAVDARGNRIAVAGRERETTLVDLETSDIVFKAKNPPPDPQTLLQHPIWPTALIFLDDSTGSTTTSGSNHVMAVGTAYKQVRLYDVRTNSITRRPISYTPEGLLSHRITALCQADAYYLVVGDAAGYLHSLDTRMLGRKRKGNVNLARFVGPAGSIRQVVKHGSCPIIATVGLDRMLRTYNIVTRKQLDCVYLKQRLNCVLMFPDDTFSTADFDSCAESQHDGNINVDDEVRDYVDSDDESYASEDGEEDSAESTDDNVTSESEDEKVDDEEEGESDDESTEDPNEEEERPQPALSKRRRM